MLKLALGPIQYYWPREVVFGFYEEIAASPIDIVYLGELVCSRRHELRLTDWLDIAGMLDTSGKQAVLSTMALIESGSDLTTMRKIAGNGRFAVEANDMGAVHNLEKRVPFVAGPHLNIYNASTLALLAGCGAMRWVMPLEMGRAGLETMQAERPAGMETEIFAYGRMPLAFSARCFTARNRNLSKDDCQFSCLDYPDGLMLQTREEREFLVLNGIQTQSASVCNLLGEWDDMRNLGVDVVRISPQSIGTEDIIALFDDVRAGRVDPAAAADRADVLMQSEPCNGFWHGKPGMEYNARTI